MKPQQDVELGQYLEADLARTLVQLGFLALSFRVTLPAAQSIFTGLVAARPARSAPVIGLALVALESDDYDTAIALLQDGDDFESDLDRQQAAAFLGMVYKKAGRQEESDRVLATIGNSEHAAVSEFTRSLEKDGAS